MMVCHECRQETSDLRYCDGQGCSALLCSNCGPTCSGCLEHQRIQKEVEEEKNRFNLGETIEETAKKMSKITDKVVEKGLWTGYKVWTKTVIPLGEAWQYWGIEALKHKKLFLKYWKHLKHLRHLKDSGCAELDDDEISDEPDDSDVDESTDSESEGLEGKTTSSGLPEPSAEEAAKKMTDKWWFDTEEGPEEEPEEDIDEDENMEEDDEEEEE